MMKLSLVHKEEEVLSGWDCEEILYFFFFFHFEAQSTDSFRLGAYDSNPER